MVMFVSSHEIFFLFGTHLRAKLRKVWFQSLDFYFKLYNVLVHHVRTD